jgi:LPXTG-motif cell wall-anchored protein
MLVYKSDESFDTFDFYTLSELTEMAMTDLEQKTGTRPESAETFIDETGTVVVQMNGADGEPADFYSVDPATGTGEDQEGGAVDLPQTGISDVQPMVWAMLAVLLTAAGVLAMAKSGVLRRRTR